MGALERAVAAQKSKVVAQRGKIGRLSELQNEVDQRRDEFIKTSVKASQFRLEAVVGDPGVTPMGTATTPKGPTFPNWLLIVPGASILGLAFGVLLALLMEMFGRRVRSPEDLSILDDVPLIGVIAAQVARRPARSPWWRTNPFARSTRRKQMAQA